MPHVSSEPTEPAFFTKQNNLVFAIFGLSILIIVLVVIATNRDIQELSRPSDEVALEATATPVSDMTPEANWHLEITKAYATIAAAETRYWDQQMNIWIAESKGRTAIQNQKQLESNLQLLEESQVDLKATIISIEYSDPYKGLKETVSAQATEVQVLQDALDFQKLADFEQSDFFAIEAIIDEALSADEFATEQYLLLAIQAHKLAEQNDIALDRAAYAVEIVAKNVHPTGDSLLPTFVDPSNVGAPWAAEAFIPPEVFNAKWSPDETKILTYGMGGSVIVWDVEAQSMIFSQSTNDKGWGTVAKAEWLNGGSEIVAFWANGNIRVLDAETGEEKVNIPSEEGGWFVDWGDNNKNLLLVNRSGYGQKGRSSIWDIQTGEKVSEVVDDLSFRTLFWDESNHQLLIVNAENILKIWDLENGDVIHRVPLAEKEDVSKENITEEYFLASMLDTGNVYLRDSVTGRLIRPIRHGGQITDAEFVNGNQEILTMSEIVHKLWDVESGKFLHAFVIPSLAQESGHNQDQPFKKLRLIENGASSTTQLWDIDRNMILAEFSYQKSSEIVELNHGLKLLFVNNLRKNYADVWDAETGNYLVRMTSIGQKNTYEGSYWNTDRSLYAHSQRTKGYLTDGFVEIIDAKTGMIYSRFSVPYIGYSNAVSTVYWNKDESQIMLTTINGQVLRFVTDEAERRKLACQRVSRNLTWREWGAHVQRYIPNMPYEKTCSNLPVHCSVPDADWPRAFTAEQELCAEN